MFQEKVIRINSRSTSYCRIRSTITLYSNREYLFKRTEEIAFLGCSKNESAARIISNLRGEFKLKKILAALNFPKATYMYWQNRLKCEDFDLAIKVVIKDIRKDKPNYEYRKLLLLLKNPHQKITMNTTEFKYYEIGVNGALKVRKLYLYPFMNMYNSEILNFSISPMTSFCRIKNKPLK